MRDPFSALPFSFILVEFVDWSLQFLLRAYAIKLLREISFSRYSFPPIFTFLTQFYLFYSSSTMKAAARQEFTSPSPTSSTKLNSATRAPRSGSGVAPKLSPPVQRAAAANDWEISQCTNKLPSAVGAGNRKRNPSTRSSSPPVAQWASQRPQKISRPARRNNFPIVPNNDEISTLDTTSDVLRNERHLSSSSPQQKLKSDVFSPAVSETEELGAAEVKSKDKSKRSDEVDEKAGNVQKMSTLLLPPRKNKVVSGQDFGDGIRRQGRSGRGFTSTRSLMPLMAEKLGNVGTAKQLRTSRHALDKPERLNILSFQLTVGMLFLLHFGATELLLILCNYLVQQRRQTTYKKAL